LVRMDMSAWRRKGAKDGRARIRFGEAGIWIIEGLDLSAVRAGRYEMICLPVKLHGSHGAPARAILRPIAQGHGERT
jgi:kynurenine formamidase